MSSTLPPPPPEERRRSFQFSMATLMGVITLIAVGLAVLFALPTWVGLFFGTTIGVAWVAFLAAGAFFAKSQYQTFCIGALAVHWLARLEMAYLVFPPSLADSNSVYTLIDLVFVITADSFAGWVCIRARRFWESRTP